MPGAAWQATLTRMSIPRRALSGFCVAAIALAGTMTPATAQAATTGQHCVMRLPNTGKVLCYNTFPEAIVAATGGRVTSAPADARAALDDLAFTEKVNKAGNPARAGGVIGYKSETIIGIEYTHIGYAGSTYTITAGWGCTTDMDYPEWEFSFWRTPWETSISSFRTYGNCWAEHFDHAFWHEGQDHTGYQPSQYYIGEWMNDRASSVRWS
jgi:hypothetical protein